MSTKDEFQHRHTPWYSYAVWSSSILSHTCGNAHPRSCPQAWDRRAFCCLKRSHSCILLCAGTRTNWHICKGWVCTVDCLSFSDYFLTFQPVTKEEDIFFPPSSESGTQLLHFSFLMQCLPHIVKGIMPAWCTLHVRWPCSNFYTCCIDVLLTKTQLYKLLKICKAVRTPHRQIDCIKKAHTQGMIDCLFQQLISHYQTLLWIRICWWHAAASEHYTVATTLKEWWWQEPDSDFICVCVFASSGSSEGEPQEEGDGGEDQESQAGEGESRAREAGAAAKEEAADWHEQRYATSPPTPQRRRWGGREGVRRTTGGWKRFMELCFTQIWTKKEGDNAQERGKSSLQL